MTATTVQGEVERLLAQEKEWSDKRASAVAEVVQSESQSGGALLDGGDEALKNWRLEQGRLTAAVSACDAAIAEARRRRVQAILDVWRAEAVELRLRAKALLDEAADLDEQAQPHIDKLREVWGVEPTVPEAKPNTVQVGSMPIQVIDRGVTKAQKLRAEADDRTRQADALERKQVVQAGAVEGDSADALIASALADPMRIAPTEHAIREWHKRIHEQERAKVSKHRPDLDATFQFRLVWAHSEIDERRSGARQVAP